MMNMMRKIEAFLKDLGIVEYSDTKITLAENGFDLSIPLGSCIPMGSRRGSAEVER